MACPHQSELVVTDQERDLAVVVDTSMKMLAVHSTTYQLYHICTLMHNRSTSKQSLHFEAERSLVASHQELHQCHILFHDNVLIQRGAMQTLNSSSFLSHHSCDFCKGEEGHDSTTSRAFSLDSSSSKFFEDNFILCTCELLEAEAFRKVDSLLRKLPPEKK